jgi:hypothetical protein
MQYFLNYLVGLIHEKAYKQAPMQDSLFRDVTPLLRKKTRASVPWNARKGPKRVISAAFSKVALCRKQSISQSMVDSEWNSKHRVPRFFL